MSLSRRQFLKVSAGTAAVAAMGDQALALAAQQPVITAGNPQGRALGEPGIRRHGQPDGVNRALLSQTSCSACTDLNRHTGPMYRGLFETLLNSEINQPLCRDIKLLSDH
ncbi:MAG: hypothetical protein OJF50_004779 [Nitrospira sp.]|jgi:hypothetical protein|nr:hypothetical protein [Nitrospira sp.]